MAYNANDSGGWSPALPASIQALEPLPGNDIVLIRSADASSVSLTPPYQSGDASKASIHLEKGHGLSKGDIAVVSDCSQATVVQITGEGGGGTSAAVTNNTGNSASPGMRRHHWVITMARVPSFPKSKVTFSTSLTT